MERKMTAMTSNHALSFTSVAKTIELRKTKGTHYLVTQTCYNGCHKNC